jgi:hypothetical protein
MGRLVKIGNGASASTRRNSTSDNASGPVVASGKKGRLVRISETPKYQLGELNPKDFQDSKRESRAEPQSDATGKKQPRANSFVQGSGMSKLQQMEAQREERQQKTQNPARSAKAAQIVREAEARSPRARSVQKADTGTLNDRGSVQRARNGYELGEKRSQGTRASKAVQSIGLNTIGSAEMLGEGLKQANENVDILAGDQIYSQLQGQYEQMGRQLNGAVQRYGMDSQEAESIRQSMNEVRERLTARRGQIEKTIDTGSHAYRTAQMGQEAASQALEGLSGVGGFLGETALSIADNASLLPLAAINPALPLVIMSIKAAGSRAKELTDQGAAAGGALSRGVVSGIIEGLSENVSLGSFLEMVNTGGRGWLLNLLKQAGVEGAEEITSYIANYAMDKAAQDPNAQFDAGEMLRQGASGALSGLVFGGAGTAVNRLNGYSGVDYSQVDSIQGDGAPSTIERSVQNVRQTLGAEGQSTFDQMRTEGQDPSAAVEYTERFVDAYNKGKRNEAIPQAAEMTEAEAETRAAWNAGRVDALTREGARNKQNQATREAGAGIIRTEYTDSLDQKTVSALDRAAKQLGVTVEFADEVAGGSANAEIQGNRITIEKWNKNPVRALFGHEITHRIQALSPDSYGEYKTVVRNAMGAEAYDAAFHEIKAISALREMELNDSQIEDEVVADYAGKLLQNDGTLERFIQSAQSKPTLLQRMAQVFRDLVNKLRGTEKAQAERALGKLEKAYREAAKAEKSGARNKDSGVKYSINNTRGMTIREQLKEYRAGRLTKHDEFYYGSAPDVLDAAGLNGRPLVMSQTDFKKAKSEKHNVPARAMTKLAESLIDPILSFETGDKIGILTKDIDGDGKPLLVGIMKNVDLDGETVNRIKSAYGLDNPQAWIGNQIKDGKELRIFDSKKADSFLDGIGYLAERPENYRMGDIVTDIRENVNPRYSLKKVPPVKPTNADWSPGASFDQVKKAHPTLFELAADEADTRNPTQITGTVKSYRKIYDKLRAEGFDGTILDASSGLGYGTRAGRTEYGFSVDDIEPFPDAKYHPNYTDYSTLDKTYDAIISNAVLNVIPQDLRDAMVVKIGELLNPGGRAFINVRGSDVKNAGSKVAINADRMEYFISNTGSYQKGFTSKELVGYLRDALGDGFTVEPTKEFGAVSAVVTKGSGAKEGTRYSLKARGVYDYTDAEKKQHAKDAAAYFGTTYKWSETGYITAAGRKLDFSGRHEGGPGGYRTVDHRDIRDALGDDYGGEDYSGSMVQFMSEGNIRISPESGGINLSVMPTKAQLDTLSDFISKQRGEVILDIDTVDGNTVSSTEYPRGTHANKVLNDIKAYFEDGSTPRVSELAQFRYSLKRPAELENAYAEIQTRVDSGEITAEEAIREKVAAVDRIYAEYVRKYGEMAPGESPARKVSVPKQTSDTTKVSQTIRTIMEAKATPESILPTLKESIANGDFDYETYTDAAAKADAGKTIRDVGWDNAQRKWFNAMENGIVTKENTALGWTLYNNAVNSGNTELAIDVLNQMVKSQRNAAQALQATRILKQLSPEGQLYQVQRSVADLQREINNRYRKDGAPKLEIDKDLAKKLMEAKDQNTRDKVLEEIYKDIGRQMPSRFIDKWNAWRYLAMLGNPRTHVRNIVGNAGFMPVVGAKNLTAQVIESVASKFSPGMERTKGMFSAKLFKAALADYANVEGAAMSGGKYSDFAAANKYVEEGRQIFGTSRWKLWNKTGGRALETLRKKNGAALDAEDVWFSKPHYANAMAQYCKANGITAEQIRSGDEKVLRKARAYAVQEAAKATYRDTNALSEAVSSIGGRWRSSDNKVKRVTGTLVEGILPFRKTPANILARGLGYSPAGLLKGLTNDLVQVKKGNMTAAQAIDNISAGLTGTGLLMLGGYLAAQGLLRGGGSGDDDKDKMDDLAGRQDYSLEVGDTSVTLDWLAPEALPLFVGVNLYETWKANNGEMQLSDYLNAIKNVSEPMVEMSCLQSLDDVFNSVATARYSGKSALTAVLVSAATSYITQVLPTIVGQAERTSEPLRMTTYTSKGKFATTDVQYFLGKSSARIPGLDYQQIPYIDAWGRTESNGASWQRAANNFLNPAYVSTIRQSDMEKEIERLYEATEDGGVVPDRADKSIKLQEGTKYLSAEEYVKYATEKGQKSYALAEELVNSAAYQAADDTRKADMIRYAYQYATAVAKTKVSDYALRGWQAKCAEVTKKTGLSEATYITLYLEQLDVEGYKDEDGDPIANSAGLQKMEVVYNMPGLTDAQRSALFGAFGVGKKVAHYNKAKVSQELDKLRGKAR